MGGPSKLIKKMTGTAVRKGIVKKVEPPKPKPKPVTKPKPKPAPKKIDKAKEAQELKLANKRKGYSSTIKTTGSGLNDDLETKKTLLT